MKTLERLLHEPMSTLTHLFGALASLAGLILLLSITWNQPGKLVSVAIYGTSMVILYSASTLFHGAKFLKRHVCG
jgi:hemolysin III